MVWRSNYAALRFIQIILLFVLPLFSSYRSRAEKQNVVLNDRDFFRHFETVKK